MKDVLESVPSREEWTTVQSQLDLSRLSEVIAEGDHPFPDSLSTELTFELAARVREFRKQRLMSLLAKMVAKDLRKSCCLEATQIKFHEKKL